VGEGEGGGGGEGWGEGGCGLGCVGWGWVGLVGVGVGWVGRGVRYIHNVLMVVTKLDIFLRCNKLSKDKLHKKLFLKCTLFIVSGFNHEEYTCVTIPWNTLNFNTL
jgi:hypothetical protein